MFKKGRYKWIQNLGFSEGNFSSIQAFQKNKRKEHGN